MQKNNCRALDGEEVMNESKQAVFKLVWAKPVSVILSVVHLTIETYWKYNWSWAQQLLK